MKLLLSALLSFVVASITLGSNVSAATPEELMKQAETAYSQREYTSAGALKAQEAADVYSEILKDQNLSVALRAKAAASLSEALYFVGDASGDEKVKKDVHLKGVEAADAALKLYGVMNVSKVAADVLAHLKTLPAEELAVVGEALYQRGTNLGSWGQANGVMASLGKWSELRDTMQLIINIGLEKIHDYGANRILGRGYFKIPGLLGGDMKKAMKYLEVAVQQTLVPGAVYSRNGHNNNFYSDVLKEEGQEDKARTLLEGFIAADPAALDSTQIPEIKKTQAEALERLNDL